ncbi:hypothetical protein [Cyanobium sp. CH-040]|uniref:hypothetical protein n=1 Tax=Cyanobium sp. CH-040 TaxID=2823708 RepID=UPI0020CC874C|nr:hypothetical protein [Cyanobium sp. CH-040]
MGDGKIIAPFYARLELGDGDDTLIARGGLEATSEGTTVSFGTGNDLVDFSQGGIDTFGGKTGIETALNLGSGDDRIIGFPQVPEPWQLDSLWTSPAGVVRGGKGRDAFVLPEGVYEISADRISTNETFLPVAGFNLLEGINGGRFSYAPGILTVNENGIASFSPGL